MAMCILHNTYYPKRVSHLACYVGSSKVQGFRSVQIQTLGAARHHRRVGPLAALKEQIIPTESSQPNEQNAAQNENSAHRLRHSKSMPKLKSLSLAVVPTALAGLLFAPAATASVVATAETTSASPQFQHLYHMVDDKTMYLGCVALGGTFAILTIVSTGRFIMSFFPKLERTARQAGAPLTLRAFVILDALLGPAQRGLFQMKEEGDVNYAAMMYLASMSVVLELLFGDAGLLATAIPDAELLHSLHYLIFFQHMLLLPQWTMAVFRAFLLI